MGGLFRFVVVALHDQRPFDADLTGLSHGHLFAGARVGQFAVDIENRQPHRTQLLLAPGRIHGGHRRGFGHAVKLQEFALPDDTLQLSLGFLGKGRCG